MLHGVILITNSPKWTSFACTDDMTTFNSDLNLRGVVSCRCFFEYVDRTCNYEIFTHN